MKLGSNISKLCKERKITLAELARSSGVPKSTVHHWINNPSAVNLAHLQKVAISLGVSFHYLVFGVPDPNEAPTEEVLKELFSGDVRVTLHRIERRKT